MVILELVFKIYTQGLTKKGKAYLQKQQISERGRRMNEKPSVLTRSHKAQEGLLSAIAVGFVFILIGIIYITTSGLWDSVVAFFGNLETTVVPGTDIYLPIPINPSAHTVLYGALFHLCLGLGVLQIIILALRFALGSSISNTAETVGNLLFWFGAAYLVNTYLNQTTNVNTWFIFWTWMLIISGLSLIARALVLLARRAQR